MANVPKVTITLNYLVMDFVKCSVSLGNLTATVNCLFFCQYVSEKIGGAKGTELDEEFMEMERVSLNS